jgi:hypothetical protein
MKANTRVSRRQMLVSIPATAALMPGAAGGLSTVAGGLRQ